MSTSMFIVGEGGTTFFDISRDMWDYQSYNLYGWLADVRNHAEVPPFHPNRGLPEDALPQTKLYHAPGHGHWGLTWYTLDELLEFDWNQRFENRRGVRQIAYNVWDHAATMIPGEGKMTTYLKEFGYFREKVLHWKAMGVERIIMSFG